MGTSSNEITVSVSEAASDVLEAPIEELPPLSDVIDPDALDTLGSTSSDDPPPRVTVIFEYAGVELVVHSGEMVYARPSGHAVERVV
jgi:hypothetical protein